MLRQQSHIKKTKNTNSKNKHAHILYNCQIIQNKENMVAYKCEKKLEVINKSLSL